ncbi:glucosyl transferase [Citrus sinensis]|uniref:Glucosyl transferase n=1 Tax=Citrus sinensis TaxID=2711 RepID=A0ACB8LX11_CITSI|nr:glucosyl transferase [Citrus sinensis]
MGREPHVLVIPFPAQGHAGPLMKLSMKIAEQGIKVTIFSTEHMKGKIVALMPQEAKKSSLITVVSVPDGLELQEAERKDIEKVTQSMLAVMPGCLKNFIEQVKESNDCEQISCVITDVTVGWALEIAEQMGIARAAVVTFAPAYVPLVLHIPKLVDAGILDSTGNATSDELILLSEDTLPWKKNEYIWSFPSQPDVQKLYFEATSAVAQSLKISNWILCNSFYELDSPACDLVPNILTIGPLLGSDHSEHSAINFWPEDSTCLSWLDKQAIGSVIYVAFGSAAVLSQQQLEELALGLESLHQPFLWVVRPDFMNRSHAKLPDGFVERVSDRGKFVEWAPQEKVLGHPSVACFLSHCGWNSSIEGLSMGVPFLCWPYFVDQYQNRNYICDAWKVGSQFFPDENGIITRQEIYNRVKALLNDDGIKANALKMKEMARKSLGEGGSSFRNFESFISQLKAIGC